MKNIKNIFKATIGTVGLAVLLSNCGGVPSDVLDNIEKNLNRGMNISGRNYINNAWSNTYDKKGNKYEWHTKASGGKLSNNILTETIIIKDRANHKKYEYIFKIDLDNKKVLKIGKR